MDIPAPVEGLALIDTGASASAVDIEVVQQLGVLRTVGDAKVFSPGIIGLDYVTLPKYPARVAFPGTELPPWEFEDAIAADLRKYRVYGNEMRKIVALVGRDMLHNFVLTYDGPCGWFSLSW